VQERFGHIDYNKATGDDIADIFGNGALASMIEASITSDPDASLPTKVSIQKPITSTLSAFFSHDPSTQYPVDIFQKLFAGGFEDSGSLSDRFAAWKELTGLPPLKKIPKQAFTSLHYKGECPTHDMKCPLVDCRHNLM